MAFYRLDPPIGYRMDYMNAQVSYVTAKAGFAKSQAKLKDFMPDWGGPRKKTDEEIMEMFRGLAG